MSETRVNVSVDGSEIRVRFVDALSGDMMQIALDAEGAATLAVALQQASAAVDPQAKAPEN